MVNPFPNNPNVFVPGPAIFFVVIDGIPSLGKYLSVGDLAGKAVPNKVTRGSPLQPLPSPILNSNFDASPSGPASQGLGTGKLIGAVAAGVLGLLLLLLGLICWRKRLRSHRKPQSQSLRLDDLAAPVSGTGVRTAWNRNGNYQKVNTPASSIHQRGLGYDDETGNSTASLSSRGAGHEANDLPSSGYSTRQHHQQEHSYPPINPSPLSHVQATYNSDALQSNESWFHYQGHLQQPRDPRDEYYGGLVDEYAPQQDYRYRDV